MDDYFTIQNSKVQLMELNLILNLQVFLQLKLLGRLLEEWEYQVVITKWVLMEIFLLKQELLIYYHCLCVMSISNSFTNLKNKMDQTKIHLKFKSNHWIHLICLFKLFYFIQVQKVKDDYVFIILHCLLQI